MKLNTKKCLNIILCLQNLLQRKTLTMGTQDLKVFSGNYPMSGQFEDLSCQHAIKNIRIRSELDIFTPRQGNDYDGCQATKKKILKSKFILKSDSPFGSCLSD